METWAAIRTQRAIRLFIDHPLEPEHLERILLAGRRAPSVQNRQRWHFIVCRDRDRLRELSRVGDDARHLAAAGAAIALVVPEAQKPGEQEWIAYDLGQLSQNMLLAAWDLGIGGAHAAVYHERDPSGARRLARKLLGYPKEYRCDMILVFGYPAGGDIPRHPTHPRGRRPLVELVHEEHW